MFGISKLSLILNESSDKYEISLPHNMNYVVKEIGVNMYGYLSYKNKSRVNKISRMYKCYYCSFCHSLKKNYGILATALLSYDLVFAAISLSSASNYADNKPMCCLYKRKNKLDDEYSSDYWKGLATASVALAYSKALDNYLDRATMTARIILGILSFLSRKARKENPDVFAYVDGAMRDLKLAEEQGGGFEIHSELSAKMISDALCDYSNVPFTKSNKRFLYEVSRWLCFVDAIDDYEKDRKNEAYNPLFMVWKNNKNIYENNFEKLISIKYIEISKIYFDILEQMNDALKEMKINENEKIFLEDMVHRVMPQKVSGIILN